MGGKENKEGFRIAWPRRGSYKLSVVLNFENLVLGA